MVSPRSSTPRCTESALPLPLPQQSTVNRGGGQPEACILALSCEVTSPWPSVPRLEPAGHGPREKILTFNWVARLPSQPPPAARSGNRLDARWCLDSWTSQTGQDKEKGQKPLKEGGSQAVNPTPNPSVLEFSLVGRVARELRLWILVLGIRTSCPCLVGAGGGLCAFIPSLCVFWDLPLC